MRGNSKPWGRRPRRVYEITAEGERELTEWLKREDPIPFELRDIGLVKLFFADALGHDDALALLTAVKQRSPERVKTLEQIEPDASQAEQEGNLYPLLTLEMGIAFHKAMVDVCDRFERRLAPA